LGWPLLLLEFQDGRLFPGLHIKDSSLAAIIAIPELMNRGQLLSTDTFRPLEILTLVAILYFFITYPLVQIVWFYFVVPVIIGMELSAFQAASIALGLNIAAFFGEIFRTGIQGIDKTQIDATRVLGLGSIDSYRYVILPQAFRIVLPPTTTTIMLLMKGTSLATAIGTLELMRVGQLISLETFRPFEILTAVALIYFLITYPVAYGMRRLERKMQIGEI